MAKNSVADLKDQKDSRAKQKAQAEAEAAAEGRDPWEGGELDDRVSFRVQSDLKKATERAFPSYISFPDAMREIMARVARGEVEL